MDDSKGTSNGVTADLKFAILPEWVLYADISPIAVRLYAVLVRFADDTGSCYPSRRLLAERCRASTDTVDRALKELVAVGAVEIKRRREGKLYRSSTYRLMPGNDPNLRPGSRMDAARGSRTGAQGGSRMDADENENQDEREPVVHPAPTAQKERKRDELWDAAVVLFGEPVGSEVKGFAKKLHELRAAGATPKELTLRVAAYRAEWPNAACTLHALHKHWGRFAGNVPAARPVSKFEANRARRRMRDGSGQSGGDSRVGRESLGLGDGPGGLRALD